MNCYWTASVLGCLLLVACGGANYNGNYSGSWTNYPSGATSSLSMTLYQEGNNISGQWVSGTTGGDLSATANGSNLNSVTLTETSVSGSPTATGTLSLSNNQLTGTVNGSVGSNMSLNLTQSQ